VLLVFGVVVSGWLYAHASGILRLLTSDTFVAEQVAGYTASDALQVISGIFLFYFVSSLFTYILLVTEHQRRLLVVNSLLCTANILGNWWLIPTYSFYGSAVSTVVSQVLLLVLTQVATRDIVSFRIPWWYTLHVVGAGGIGVYASIRVQEWLGPLVSWWVHFAVGSGVYAAALLVVLGPHVVSLVRLYRDKYQEQKQDNKR
jgi:O-antigen/teichoic acid export membrane protein